MRVRVRLCRNACVSHRMCESWQLCCIAISWKGEIGNGIPAAFLGEIFPIITDHMMCLDLQ